MEIIMTLSTKNRPKLNCQDPFMQSSEWTELKYALNNGRPHYWCSFYIGYSNQWNINFHSPQITATIYDTKYDGKIIPDNSSLKNMGIECLKEYKHFDIPSDPSAAYKVICSEWKKFMIEQDFKFGDENELPEDAYENYLKINNNGHNY